MYPLPDDILSYVHIDQSILLGILAGVFLLPFPFLLVLMLFWGWQEELAEEYPDEFNRLKDMGFEALRSSISPSYAFIRSRDQVYLYVTPLLAWVSVMRLGKIKIRKTLSKTELFSFIDLLDPVEPTSKLRDE